MKPTAFAWRLLSNFGNNPLQLGQPGAPPRRTLQCGNSPWDEGRLTRLSFQFTGCCDHRWGQWFLDAVQQQGFDPQNWEAWPLNQFVGYRVSCWGI